MDVWYTLINMIVHQKILSFKVCSGPILYVTLSDGTVIYKAFWHEADLAEFLEELPAAEKFLKDNEQDD